MANIIIPRRGADTNRVEAAATRPGAIDISQKRPAVAPPSISSEILLQYFWRTVFPPSGSDNVKKC